MRNTYLKNDTKKDNLILKRGDVFYANLVENGSIQGGIRPVIIISNDMNNKFSTVVHVIPVTSKVKKKLPVHVLINKNNIFSSDSQALVEQLTTINKNDLCEKKGSLPKDIIEKIETAIRIQLGFAA